jgi:dTDP-glucose 4,6-dehydratase
MKKILVTGGAGFIGSNFVRLISEERPDWRIMVLDKLTYAGRMENLEGVNPTRLQFLQGDICDPHVVSQAMDGCQMVFNFAAETHVDRSLIEGAQHAGSFIQTNTYGVYVLLEESQKRGVEKFLHVSTDEVYGDVARGHSVESDTLLPRSPYAASKAGGELIARSYFVSHGVPVVITRGSNNFGPYQFPEKLIPLFITNALDDLPLPLYGDGLQQRDFLFVGDHCRGILLCAEQGQSGEAYNIGGDNEHTNREITSLILEMLHKDESLIRYVEDRPGHDRRYSLNCDKIHALGWHPQMTFEDAFRMTVAWYRKHEDWWRSIKNGADYQAYYQKNYGGRAGFNDGLNAVK